MYILKGFMSMPSLADDGYQKTGEFGELSTHLQTFTRDMRNYAITAQPDVELFVFRCIDEMENRTNPSASFREQLLAFGQWVYSQLITSAIPPDRNKPAFIQTITAQFPMMSNISVGEILESSTTAGRHCPDYVQFKILDGSYQYQVQLWFSDGAMVRQYDHFEVFVIPPVPEIRGLINTKPNVWALLQQQTSDFLINRMQSIIGSNPQTVLHSYPLTWHDPEDFNATIPTKWTVIIYGAAGNDDEAIKEKIKEYIADNSDYTKWPEIYPELYTETEFAFFPMWNKIALDGNALQIGIYSPLASIKDIKAMAKTYLPSGYQKTGMTTDQFLDANLFSGTANYRTIAFGTVGNPNNKDGKTTLQDLYPDVNLALSTTDNDFGRMSLTTQEFCTKFHEALDVAREYDPSEPLDPAYTRMTRRGNYFVAFKFNDFVYTFLTKYSYDKAQGDN